MIGVREREAVIDLTGPSTGRDQRRDIVRALMFAHGIDERGRRLPLAIDRVPVALRSRRVLPTAERFRDARAASIYAIADLDDGLPNVRIIGRSRGAMATAVPQTPTAPLTRGARSTRRRATSDQEGIPGSGDVEGPAQGGAQRATASSRTSSAARSTNGGAAARFLTVGNAALATDELPQVERREEARTRADLRVVPRPVSMWGRRLTALFWTMFIVGLLFVAVVMHATLAERQGQLDDTHVKVERAERDHELLRIDVAKLESPERITAIAAQMGLVTPQRIRFVTPTGAMSTAATSDAGTSDTSR